MSRPDRFSVVYLGGFGRSGTTLLERVLGGIDGWSNMGELVDLARTVTVRDELCGCGRQFSGCPVWTAVGDLAFGGWSRAHLDRLERLRQSVARQRHMPALLRNRGNGNDFSGGALGEFQDAYSRIYAAFAEVTGSRVIVDASKGPAFGFALSGSPAIDMRVINLVRDPRGVAWSWSKRVSRPQTDGHDEMWRIPSYRSAGQWMALQVEMEAVARIKDLPSARMRYEDFIDDAMGAVVDVIGRIGLATTRSALGHISGSAVELGASHGLSGNPGRFALGTTNLKSDTSWRTQMGRSDRAVATALTLPLLVAYQYPISAAQPVCERQGAA